MSQWYFSPSFPYTPTLMHLWTPDKLLVEMQVPRAQWRGGHFCDLVVPSCALDVRPAADTYLQGGLLEAELC